MAYFFPDIIYVNLSSIDRLFLKAFIYKNEKIYDEWEQKCNPNPMFSSPYFGNPIEIQSKFEKFEKNGNIYFHNEYRGLFFEEKDIKKDGEYYVVEDKKENYYS